jgi:acetyltransferase-like isoleucine patch superfamily enzyme
MSNRIAKTAILHPNVHLGEGVVVEDHCILGCPGPGRESGELATYIGAGSVLRAHTIVYAGNRIGRGFQTGNKANIREENRIGDKVSVGTLSVVEHHVEIGDGVRIHTQVFVPEYSLLEDGCWLGPNVVLTNAKYPLSPGVKGELQGPKIRQGAIIGANETLLPGVEIGARALVGAGSVITRDVGSATVWAGNPARKIKDLDALPYPS